MLFAEAQYTSKTSLPVAWNEGGVEERLDVQSAARSTKPLFRRSAPLIVHTENSWYAAPAKLAQHGSVAADLPSRDENGIGSLVKHQSFYLTRIWVSVPPVLVL
jgi:hypothetical protein